jgi:hypothetical protein
MSTRIGFSTNKTSWISRIIRWFTKSTVSHTFIIYYDVEWEQDMVMESEGGFGGSVRIVRFNPECNSIVKIVEPKYSIEVGMRKMVDKLGEVYDYSGLFGMAWVMLGRWLRKKWHNPMHNSKALFCSELVAEVLKDSSYPGSSILDPATTTPEDLLIFFENDETK